jgi:hypothetical protein
MRPKIATRQYETRAVNAPAIRGKRGCRIGAAIAVAALIACATASHAHAEAFNFPPTDFTIYTPDGRTELGKSRYTVEPTPEGAVLRGEDYYNSGESDIEVDRLEMPVGGGPPQLLEFRHSFFAAGGAPTMIGYANIRSGLASCTGYSNGDADTVTDRLTFPDDTYAGASVLVPIQLYLRSGAAGPLKLHVFSCTPSPRVVAIEVSLAPKPKSLPYPGNLVEVVVTPDFGWWNFLVSPFVPKLEAWFAPTDQFGFVGGQLARFYKGPDILMVKTGGHPAAAAQAER